MKINCMFEALRSHNKCNLKAICVTGPEQPLCKQIDGFEHTLILCPFEHVKLLMIAGGPWVLDFQKCVNDVYIDVLRTD